MIEARQDLMCDPSPAGALWRRKLLASLLCCVGQPGFETPQTGDADVDEHLGVDPGELERAGRLGRNPLIRRAGGGDGDLARPTRLHPPEDARLGDRVVVDLLDNLGQKAAEALGRKPGQQGRVASRCELVDDHPKLRIGLCRTQHRLGHADAIESPVIMNVHGILRRRAGWPGRAGRDDRRGSTTRAQGQRLALPNEPCRAAQG